MLESKRLYSNFWCGMTSQVWDSSCYNDNIVMHTTAEDWCDEYWDPMVMCVPTCMLFSKCLPNLLYPYWGRFRDRCSGLVKSGTFWDWRVWKGLQVNLNTLHSAPFESSGLVEFIWHEENYITHDLAKKYHSKQVNRHKSKRNQHWQWQNSLFKCLFKHILLKQQSTDQ